MWVWVPPSSLGVLINVGFLVVVVVVGMGGADEGGICIGRRVGASASIKLSATPSRRRSASPATTSAAATSHTHQRSRLSRQVLPPEESEEEAEAEENTEEMEDADAEEDDKIYCFCRKKSFGDVSSCSSCGLVVVLMVDDNSDDCVR